jgi:diguanylate cyclase (GGDEF)-like protein
MEPNDVTRRENAPQPQRIWLFLSDSSRRREWAAWLSESPALRLVAAEEDAPSVETPESSPGVVICDWASLPEAVSALAAASPKPDFSREKTSADAQNSQAQESRPRTPADDRAGSDAFNQSGARSESDARNESDARRESDARSESDAPEKVTAPGQSSLPEETSSTGHSDLCKQLRHAVQFTSGMQPGWILIVGPECDVESEIDVERVGDADKPPNVETPSLADTGRSVVRTWVPDATLPEDVSPRELRQTCHLVGQIARLRHTASARQGGEASWYREALSDPLTGIPNRRAWDHQLAAHFQEAVANGTPIGIALLDLDHFKRVNDAHGHLVGDAVLQATAAVLRGSLRGHDFVARLGGDEFGVLLMGLQRQSCRRIIERLRTAIPEQIRNHREAESLPTAFLPPTASAGMAIARGQDIHSAEALFDKADRALYAAKQQGRDRTCFEEEDAG